jgi:hypothetical protein
MRKTALTTAILAIALAGVAQADDGSSTSTSTATATAQKLCRAERGTTDATRAAFTQKYGTNKNKKNAFGKCVSKQAAAQAKQDDAASEDASKACTTEQGTTPETQAAFADKYGTNKNKKNAFGKCVSQKTQDAVQADDAAEVSAAKACNTERGTTDATRTAFTQKYGTNKNKKNAFGKCVSQKAATEDHS